MNSKLPERRGALCAVAAALLSLLASCATWAPSSEPVDIPEPEVRTTGSGVQIQELQPGQGERVVGWGTTVGVHYVGSFQDGTVFDSSYDRGKPMKITLGEEQVIPGWEEGLIGMRHQGRRILTIPPEQAYGDEGRGDVIPPGATLVLEVEIAWFAKQAAAP